MKYNKTKLNAAIVLPSQNIQIKLVKNKVINNELKQRKMDQLNPKPLIVRMIICLLFN